MKEEMTGYTVHTGSSEKFTQGWDQIFSKAKTAKKSTAKADQPVAEAAAPKKAAKKSTKKKS